VNGQKISFDGWVLDRESGELTRAGASQRLQELPLRVLDLLMANPGRVVTREQLVTHLWPKGVVDFDTGLNTAVRKLRLALGDVAETPRYIETLPRRGYRFLATIDSAAAQEPELPHSESETPAAPPLPAVTRRDRRPLFIAGGAVIALIAGIAYWVLHRASEPVMPSTVVVAAPLGNHTVAVLPFENLSAEANNEFLALGIAETVLHRLAGLKELTVIARTSSFAFKNRNEDARDIGRKLNARYLVAGSVQRAGERLRVTAELVDAGSGGHLWSLSFDRQIGDIFVLQDEISDKVAEALSVSLAALPGRAADERTSKVDAYLAYMQGRALMNTFRVVDTEAAIERFEHAVEFDPQFAAAYAQEARAVTQLLTRRDRDDPAARARAASLNDKALSLDASLGEAWVQRASTRDASNKEEAVIAEQEYRKGLTLAPNDARGFTEFADFLFNLNRVDEALAMVERARQVDPLAPRNHYLKGLFLWILDKDMAQVESLYLQALSINPNYHPALARLGQMRAFRGDYAEGVKLLERALAIDPQAQWVREFTVVAYLNIGDAAAARDVLGTTQGPAAGVNICILTFEGARRAAAEAAHALFNSRHPEVLPASELCAARSIRDEALAARQYDQAVRTLAAQYGVHSGALDEAARIAFVWGLPYAQVLRAKGEQARATKVARAALAAIERSIDDPQNLPEALYWRAVALGVLGDADGALQSLEAAVRGGHHWCWWLIDREPAFAALEKNVRYQAIIAELSDSSRKQATLVAEMRKTHALPQRPAGAAP
jgi:TolB-like protein/DNA-binding winged helix-turn-helix (wHTH) protein